MVSAFDVMMASSRAQMKGQRSDEWSVLSVLDDEAISDLDGEHISDLGSLSENEHVDDLPNSTHYKNIDSSNGGNFTNHTDESRVGGNVPDGIPTATDEEMINLVLCNDRIPLSIDRQPFKQLIHKILVESKKSNHDMTSDAINAFLEASEAFLISQFHGAGRIARHAGRETLECSDLTLAYDLSHTHSMAYDARFDLDVICDSHRIKQKLLRRKAITMARGSPKTEEGIVSPILGTSSPPLTVEYQDRIQIELPNLLKATESRVTIKEEAD